MALTGPCVLVTRPQPQADQWVAQLQGLGVSAAALPLLGIAPPADQTAVHAAWQCLAQAVQAHPLVQPDQPAQPAPPSFPALAMFVSPTAVERFFAARPAGQPWPPRVIAAGTGPGTRQALRRWGVPESALCTPPEPDGPFDSEALWRALQGRAEWADWAGSATVGAAPKTVLIVRGEGGRDWLADTMRQHGATVHFVEAYRRTTPVLDAAGRSLLSAALAQPAGYVWLLSSSQAVAGLGPLVQPPPQGPGLPADWGRARALATHPRIALAARRLGFGTVQTVSPWPDSIRLVLHGLAVPGDRPDGPCAQVNPK